MEALLNIFPHFTKIVERIAVPGWKIEREICQVHNLILIYDGVACFYCNGEEYRGVAGDLIYYRPGDLRWADTFPDQLLKCYAVDFLYTCPIWANGYWKLTDPALPFDTKEPLNDPYLFSRLTELFGSLTREWLPGNAQPTLLCRALFMEIINWLFLWKIGGGIKFDQFHKVEKVIHHITKYYDQPLTLAKLAAIIKVSPSYLGTIFKEATGASPIDFLIRVRLNKAKELLSEGYSITETAYQVGYHDLFYFSKSFKKHEWVAPSKYLTFRPEKPTLSPTKD
jgi:AraC-like DNA-binding protein